MREPVLMSVIAAQFRAVVELLAQSLALDFHHFDTKRFIADCFR